ncbi:glycosyltransferase family 2 protein [Actinomyces sp. MRS3W]|uniref:glycosyltransferase family 2 protein n=1 Tax=Actinomyces sp. MRS3W TaxID=2800796 RepID=UPI0028FD0CD9|nr:glycosyltransferase [Actinomyces sp. MRS3W]MDU0347530.1 glycosyltransferase [Actinomyces sp. MRS3W]
MSPARSAHPVASLVIPSYRGADRLPVLLEALARQDTDDFEALVVVDGRVDDSPALVEAAAAAGVPVRALVLEKNQGRVAALNAGFNTARGEVLVRCDDDLEPGPDYVSGHIARHRAAPSPIGVVGLTRDVLPNNAYARAYGRTRVRRSLADSYAGVVPPWRHWAANCSVTRATWERLGGYDPAYQHYGWEDVDYGYRLHTAGIAVVLAPELETLHHGAATSARSRTLRAYHSGAARRTFDALHSQALPAPTAGDGWWAALVGTVERLGAEGRFEALASRIDQALPLVPTPVGEKLVALAVESAALAGYAHAESVVARF